MQGSRVAVKVTVKYNQVTEYKHQGLTFIEGRPGSEFEIEISNQTNARYMAILSVDGLSVTDGKPAGEHSPGYLLEPYASLRIPGWTLNQDQVAKFVFANRKESYANSSSGSDVNCGVIGVMLFDEKIPQFINTAHTISGATANSIGGMGSYSTPRSLTDHVPRTKGIGAPQVTLSAAQSTQNMGTAFGNAAEFSTCQVEFKTNKMVETLVIYYDDAKGLKARGIVLVSPNRLHYQTAPNPFPASSLGCKPPPGWRP